ncbi:hypothetical protein [Bradyrhizobium sp. B117]|uniref:hypothetical protein n=1 Tax=Bradyrhizobium sp. B117 TaxID=3140246 RepID=UPI0031835036
MRVPALGLGERALGGRWQWLRVRRDVYDLIAARGLSAQSLRAIDRDREIEHEIDDFEDGRQKRVDHG